jgi:alpha-L-fucosidase
MASRDPQLKALRQRRIPAWWQDAKLGIFVHWTMASVPAFAPIGTEFSTLLKSEIRTAYSLTPYVEWYENSLRFPDSPVAAYHREHYGNQPFEDFRAPFEASFADFDAAAWAKSFKQAGARYVVFVTKHADGYCLWPTGVRNPHRPRWNSSRDIVGELADAVRAEGMRFGLYYSGGMDWTFNQRPVGAMSDVVASIPRAEYVAYADAQVRELIERYRPSVLWNDIAWPGDAKSLWSLFEYYYEQVPDGVVNDRWLPWSGLMALSRTAAGRKAIDSWTLRQTRKDGGLIPPPPPHYDVRTPEYVVFPDVQRRPWECVRGMDESFGYNAASREEDFISHGDLLWLLTDIVAKGGNLLLNVGPRGVDAQIPDEQLARLQWLGNWVTPNYEAIGSTRPWIRAGDTVGDVPVRFTADGNRVFAFLRSPGSTVTIPDVRATVTTSVNVVGGPTLTWRDSAMGLEIDVPASSAVEPMVLSLHDVEARSAP